MKKYDVIIIGGGAAGLAAAAGFDLGTRVCILEKNKVPGRKVMATGGGRCNITNESCEHKMLTLDFFKSLGLELYSDDEGRYYPYSNRAADVVKTLLNQIDDKGIEVFTEFEVISVKKEDGKFLVRDKSGKIVSGDNLLIATGGKAAPQLGATGDGYRFARNLGHSVKTVYPILTGIECGDFKDIKGVRAKGTVSLFKDHVPVARETGEIQFTEDGISGICVMNMTIHIKAERGEKLVEALNRYYLTLDLAPDFTAEEMKGRTTSFGILTEKLAARVGVNEIKEWKLGIKSVKGWKNAQCTAGGVSLEEIDMDTMESKLVKNLFFAGEIIDVQGVCGGYNLQNAWETAIKVSAEINRKLLKKEA